MVTDADLAFLEKQLQVLRRVQNAPYRVMLCDRETGAIAYRDCVVCYAIEGDCSRHREG